MAKGAIAGRAVASSPIVGKSSEVWVEIVEDQVRALKFGSVQILVHDGRVVQVETTSKIRFDKK